MPIITVVLDEQPDNKQDWRPLHQCLLMLFDSPLNHAAHLEVFIRLYKDKRLIKMHREVRIPRTFKRFEQLFCNFIQGCDMPLVQTKDGPARLLQFSNKSIEKHLQQNGSKVYRISNLTPKVRPADFFTQSLDTHKRFAFILEFGPVDFNILGNGRETEYEIKSFKKQFEEETYSISMYPLSPCLTCVKLTTAFERALDIL